MKKNLGTIDRALRALLGTALVILAITGGHVWAWIGVVLLLTAAVGFCPAYCPLKLSTRSCGGACGSPKAR
jgi:hypothetical protein